MYPVLRHFAFLRKPIRFPKPLQLAVKLFSNALLVGRIRLRMAVFRIAARSSKFAFVSQSETHPGSPLSDSPPGAANRRSVRGRSMVRLRIYFYGLQLPSASRLPSQPVVFFHKAKTPEVASFICATERDPEPRVVSERGIKGVPLRGTRYGCVSTTITSLLREFVMIGLRYQ